MTFWHQSRLTTAAKLAYLCLDWTGLQIVFEAKELRRDPIASRLY